MASSRKSSAAEAAARLEAHVAGELQQVPTGTDLACGLSGGMDSIVLLELLRRVAPARGIALRALHVNHGLSPHAAEWEAFCRRHCRRRRVPFQAVAVRVQGEGANVEANARAARYRAFAAGGAAFIALAHHRDDQAETLLLNLMRGSGVQGLAAMPPLRVLDAESINGAVSGSRILRPLLAIGRAELARYARLRRLTWIEDEANRNPRFARNFVRHKLLPLLERRFPGARETLARSAAHLGAAAALLDQFAADDCAAAAADDGLSVERLVALGEVRAANALRHFLARHGERPPALVRTREILRQLGAARADALPAIDLERVSVRRHRGRLALVPREPTQSEVESEVLPWNRAAATALGDGSALIAACGRGEGVSAARLEAAPVTIRRRSGGERMRVAPRGSTRTLKNLLQEAGVEPWLRARMPLLYCGEELVWAPFVGTAAAYRAGGRERAWRFAWRLEDGREFG